MIKCKLHNKKLICPSCNAARGGRARARKLTDKQLTEIGKLGGRPRKKRGATFRMEE